MWCLPQEIVLLIFTTVSTSRGLALDLEGSFHEKRNNTQVIPAPIVVPPSEYFDGIDGSWSTFNIRVGTPPQSVRVVASTNSPDTLVVLPGGCLKGAIPDGVPENCPTTRGGTFNNTLSTSWIDQGWFSLNGGNYGFEANLGYGLNGFNLDYGTDTLGLGFQAGVDSPTLMNQTVAAYDLPNPLYLGLFGLGTQPIIYSKFGNYSAPSFFQTLRTQNLIPSLTWSYTAGAKYRLASGQYAQLIFGGYDRSRFQPNDLSFTLSADVTRDIVVGVQSILYSGTTTTSLLSEPIYAFIESTDPNIWLPESACLLFEEAFGITYDNGTEKYLMNSTQFTSLSAADPSVTIRLASSTAGGSTVDITLPFSAFALKAEYPFVPNATYYFPLKRAANETQYTLGRAFLQEAYLTVDYDRGNFSVSQCTWTQGATSDVSSILSPSYTSSPSNSTSSIGSSSTNKSTITTAVAGVVLGVAALAGILGTGYLFYRKKLQKVKKEKEVVLEELQVAREILKPGPETDKMVWTEEDEIASRHDKTSMYKKAVSLYSQNSKYHADGDFSPAGDEVHMLSADGMTRSEMGDTESVHRHELAGAAMMPMELHGESRVVREAEGLSPFRDRRRQESPNPSFVGRDEQLLSPLTHRGSDATTTSDTGLLRGRQASGNSRQVSLMGTSLPTLIPSSSASSMDEMFGFNGLER